VRVLLTGSGGMLGSSILQSWHHRRPGDEIVGMTRADADLRNRDEVMAYVAEVAPDAVIHAAAKVDGIAAKVAHPTKYLLENLLIDTSVVSAALAAEVPELLYIGSASVYPEGLRQPLVESDMLTGSLEGPSEGYSLAKISGTKLCEYASREFGYAYRAAAPSNLYGPNGGHSLQNAHLIDAAFAKVTTAIETGAPVVEVWGDGTARREFTYVHDLADWLVDQVGSLAAWPPMVNLGYGTDFSVREYYELVGEIAGFDGSFFFDTSKPAGVHQRLLDSSAARALGWNPATEIRSGLEETYRSFLRARAAAQS
jgi:GDP-L-fucose synthase